MKMAELLETIWRDMLYALRTMRKSRAFSATAVLTLALGIGGNTAMFTVIRSVLLKPLAYHDPDRLVEVSGGATPIRFEEMKTAARSYAALGDSFLGGGVENITLSGGSEPEILKAARVSANFLDILEVKPLLGRGFRPEEDTAAGPRVAMISANLWRRRFGGDPEILGKTAMMAANDIHHHRRSAGWFPVSISRRGCVDHEAVGERKRQQPRLERVRPIETGRGSPTSDGGAGHSESTLPGGPSGNAGWQNEQRGTRNAAQRQPGGRRAFHAVDAVRRSWICAADPCANIASLLLARASSRSREFAVRAAVGASRFRLIRQLLAESVVLAVAGGALGVLLAKWSLIGIARMTAWICRAQGRFDSMEW